jgi:hypothetical protein
VRFAHLALLASLAGAPPVGAAGLGFFAHLPAGGCTPPAPTTSDRTITCTGGLDGTAPTAPAAAELSLSTTSADEPHRTATFRFASAPLAARTVIAPGAATASVFVHASGTGAPRSPADVGVELHRMVGANETAFATGLLTAQSLPSGPGVLQRFDVPTTVTAPFAGRALEPGDRLVMVVTVVNRTSSSWKAFLAFDATLAPTGTGVLPACDAAGLPDTDGDGVPDVCDNCPPIANPGQEDTNADDVGDACQCLSVERPGACVPGGGPPSSDCLAELLPAGAQLGVGPGGFGKSATCTDGDPACDADGNVDGVCTMKLMLCLDDTDPRLPCTPDFVGSVEVKKPSALKPKDATDASNAVALESAAHSLGVAIIRHRQVVTPGPGTSTPNACAFVAPASFVVPIAARGGTPAPTTRQIALTSTGRAATGRTVRDSDRLKITCVPGVPKPTTTTTTTTTTSTTSTTVLTGCPPVGGSARAVVVQLTPPFGQSVAGATFLLDYPEDVVTIPGSGNASSVTAAISGVPPGVLASAFDLDTALRVAVASAQNLPAGPMFTVTFEDCQGATPPQATDFVCTVDAVDGVGLPVPGTTCSVTLP